MASHVNTTIRYDGPALANHEMDVQDLAPALLALGNIAKIANQTLNGDRATVRVLMKGEAEQGCFQLDLSLVQSLLDHAATLIGRERLTTAAELAQIIGFVGAPLGGLFWLYKKIYGGPNPPAQSDVVYRQDDSTGSTVITVKGDGNQIVVANQTAVLARDPRVLEQVKAVLEPLKKPDVEDFSIRAGGKPIVEIDRREAANIREKAAPLLDEGAEPTFVSTIQGQVEIATAQYKGSAQWGLWWTGRTRLMKMDDEEWLQRFQAGLEPSAIPGAWLDVLIEITQPRDTTQPATYVVKKVNRVIPKDRTGDGDGRDRV